MQGIYSFKDIEGQQNELSCHRWNRQPEMNKYTWILLLLEPTVAIMDPKGFSGVALQAYQPRCCVALTRPCASTINVHMRVGGQALLNAGAILPL